MFYSVATIHIYIYEFSLEASYSPPKYGREIFPLLLKVTHAHLIIDQQTKTLGPVMTTLQVGQLGQTHIEVDRRTDTTKCCGQLWV